MTNKTYTQRPYIGNIDIDWEEERKRQEEINWERYDEITWNIEQDMLEYDNKAFNEMIYDYEAWGNID